MNGFKGINVTMELGVLQSYLHLDQDQDLDQEVDQEVRGDLHITLVGRGPLPILSSTGVA